MKRVAANLSILLALGLSLRADTLSLPTAQQLLFENNLDVRIAEARHERSTIEAVKARAAAAPTLEGYTSWGWQSKLSRMQFENAIPFNPRKLSPMLPDTTVTIPMSMDQEIGQRNRAELGINLNYPFSLGLSPIYDVKAKEVGTEIQSLALQSLRNALSLKLGLLYFQWELAVQKVAVQQVLLDDLREYHLHMRNLQQGGMQSQAKVLEARARLEKANVELLTAQSAVDSLLLELSDFIQLKDSAAQPKTYDLRRLSKTGSPHSVYRNFERAELVALDRQGEQLDLYKRALLGRRLPGLNFQLGLRYGNPGLNMTAEEYMSWAVLGLQLRWMFYDGRENWAQRTMLEQDKAMLKLERQKQEDGWNKMADQALLQIAKARRMQEATGISLEAAQAYAEDLHNAVQAGVAVTVEYLEALQAVSETRYTLAAAQAMEKMAFLQLQYSRGEEIQF